MDRYLIYTSGKHVSEVITISTVQEFTDYSEAIAFKKTMDLIYGTKPKTGKLIRCNETGEIFESVAAAAKAHDLTYQALHNHLKGKVGHRTVKGKTYERLDEVV